MIFDGILDFILCDVCSITEAVISKEVFLPYNVARFQKEYVLFSPDDRDFSFFDP